MTRVTLRPYRCRCGRGGRTLFLTTLGIRGYRFGGIDGPLIFPRGFRSGISGDTGMKAVSLCGGQLGGWLAQKC
jgi:hypothetical protein